MSQSKKPKYYKKKFVFDCELDRISDELTNTLSNSLTSQSNQVCEINEKFKPKDKYADKFIALLVDSKLIDGKLHLDLNIKHDNSSFKFNSEKIKSIVGAVVPNSELTAEISRKKTKKQPVPPLKLPPKKGQRANSQPPTARQISESSDDSEAEAEAEAETQADKSVEESETETETEAETQAPQTTPASNISELIKKTVGTEEIIDLPDIEPIARPKPKPKLLAPKRPLTQIKKTTYYDSDVDAAEKEDDSEGYSTDRYNEEYKLFKLSEKKRIQRTERKNNLKSNDEDHPITQSTLQKPTNTTLEEAKEAKKADSWMSFFTEDRVVSFCVGLLVGTKLK